MAFSGEFISSNSMLFGLGALLVVGCADAAQHPVASTAVTPDGNEQTQVPHQPASTTNDASANPLETTPPAVSSSHDVTKHGVSGDPVVRPQQSKTPQGAGSDDGADDVTP